jgi:tetratricopeptide (TPR) repeat protein
VIARAAVVALALPAIAWLALSYRNAGIELHAQSLVAQQSPPRSEVDRALRDLDRADRLNPDQAERRALRFGLHVRGGRLDLARADLEELLRREPANAEAWLLLASLTRESDPGRSAQARARLRALNPRGAREGRPD